MFFKNCDVITRSSILFAKKHSFLCDMQISIIHEGVVSIFPHFVSHKIDNRGAANVQHSQFQLALMRRLSQ